MNIPVFSRAWTAVRAPDWWAYKIPPLLATAYAGLGVFHLPPQAWRTVAAAFSSILLIAVYGYVLNDVCDVDADRLSRRPNRMAHVGIAGRIALLVLSAASALTLAWLPGDPVMVALATLNLVLPTLYSVPPVRFKGRGLLGALADAGGVHAVPMALVARAVTLDAGGPGWLVTTFVATTIGWALLAGLRGIIVHQVRDQGADELADVNTLGAALGLARAHRLIMRRLLPAEIVSLGVFLAIVLPHAPAAAIVVGIFTALELVKVRRGWTLQFFDQTGTERYVPLVSNEIYEVWLPFAFALELALRVPGLWLLVVVQVAVFFPNLRVRVGGLSALLPDRRSGLWPPKRRRRPANFQVIVGTTVWTVNGVNVFSANLVRGLIQDGVPSHIVVTEQETDLVASPEVMLPRPADVPIELLPVGPTNGWGRHWGGMVRYLEEAAPCVYIPNHDWRHSLISSQLSNDVVVVGIIHSDDPMHYDHVRRVGRYWNALVAVSDAVAQKAVELCPEVADRITTIPIGVRIPASRPRRPPASGRLRVIYHGILKQHQKRVLDFPRIVQATLELGVPIELTIVGAGPDESALRRAAELLVSRGAIRFLGVVSPEDTPAILDAQDVYLLASEFEGMPNALIEAMGRGLVPVVSRTTSGIPELVRDGKNGFVVPIGDADAFADRLRTLWRRPFRRRRMAARAYRTVSKGHFRVEDMVESYRNVFDRAWHDARAGRFIRPKGPISPLPAEVAGVNVFPVETPHVIPDLGAFPSLEDAEDYDAEIRMLAKNSSRPRLAPARPSPASLDHVRVIVASSVWTYNGVNLWSEELVRGLRSARVDARLLLTEESTRMVTIDERRMARPSDIPIEELQVIGADNWGARWGAMVRTLEAAAPCIYIPNHDWRHSCVVPALSSRVAVVGLLHDAGPLYTEHASRLGDYWNAVVATSRPIAQHVRRTLPHLSNRVATIPHGVRVLNAPCEKANGDGRGALLIPAEGYGESALSLIRAIVESNSHWPLVAVDPPDADQAWLLAAGVRVVIRPGRLVWLELCASSHFVVYAGSHPALRLLAVEAMGHGCIPVTVGPVSPDTASRRQVRDTGITIPDGQWHDAARILQEVVQDADKRNRMAAAAHRVAREAAHSSEQMIAAYLELFQRVITDANSGLFARQPGAVLPPPAFVQGISIFPVSLTHSTDVGDFPTPDDEAGYRAELGVVAKASLRRRRSTTCGNKAQELEPVIMPEEGRCLRDAGGLHFVAPVLPSPLSRRLWRTHSNVCADPPWGLLRAGESHLLYYLARDYYRGVGVIVDGGSFLGRSAWFLATGLAANPNLEREKKRPIHCFDNFIVNDDLTTEAIQKQFGVRLPLGASTRRLFDTAVVNVAEWLEVHEGDFHTYVWEPRPIEILFVDIAKSTALNQRLVESMFPCLLPGISIVVQQDYHHPWLPHIHTTMEHLSDYFEIVEPKIDDSTAFLCIRPISAEVAAEAATLHDRLPPAALLALMDRAIARLPAEDRCHVELAKANLVGRTCGIKSMQAELARIDDEYGARTSDEVWALNRRHMQDFLESLPWDQSEAWRLVSSGLVAEGLAAAEEAGPNVTNYVDALVLRAHCLRLLRRTREAAEALDRAVQEREGEPNVWIETAWLRLEQGDVPGAVEAGRRAHQCCVGRGDSVEGNAFDVLGLALSAAGRRQEALSTSAQAVACDPTNAWILVHHADNLVHLGELTEAAALVKAALAIDPEHSGATNTCATLEARCRRNAVDPAGDI